MNTWAWITKQFLEFIELLAFLESSQKYLSHARSPAVCVITRAAEVTEKGEFNYDQNSETTEFISYSRAHGAGDMVFNYPQGELFEQNDDFSNSAQHHGFPLRSLRTRRSASDWARDKYSL